MSYELDISKERLTIPVGGSDSVKITVANRFTNARDTNVTLRALGDLDEAWCTVEPSGERTIEAGSVAPYTIQISLPAGTALGAGEIELVAFEVQQPTVAERSSKVRVVFTAEVAPIDPIATPWWKRWWVWLIGALLLVGIVVGIIMSLDDEHAELWADVTTGPAPLTVTFKDATPGVPPYRLWQFNDGDATSQSAEPKHTFKMPGDYEVKLFVGQSEDDAELRVAAITIQVAAGEDPVPDPTETYAAPVVDSFKATPQKTQRSSLKPNLFGSKTHQFAWTYHGDVKSATLEFGDQSARILGKGTKGNKTGNLIYSYSSSGRFRARLVLLGMDGTTVEKVVGVTTGRSVLDGLQVHKMDPARAKIRMRELDRAR